MYRREQIDEITPLLSREKSNEHTATVNCLIQSGKTTAALVSTWMGDRVNVSITSDSPLDETLNRDPWHCSCSN